MKLIIKSLALCVLAFGVNAQTGNETLGIGSGSSITTGDYNTALGDSSMPNLTTGSHNTAIGWKSGYNLTTSREGVYIGYEAGYSDDDGFDNIMIGFRAGFYNTGSENTFIGNGAGFRNINGVDNTFIGDEAGSCVTSGSDNTYIGHKAGPGFSTTTLTTATNYIIIPATGSDNTAVGSESGRGLTTGFRNAFFGSDAGRDNTTGFWNTFVGDSAGVDNSSGFKNTFIGQGAGSATEFASNNTFIGYKAGGDNNRTNNSSINNAQRNTYVGTQAGSINREGSDNVGLGTFANFSGLNYSRSIFIGSGGEGFDNTGWYRGFGMVRASDVIVMGYKAQNSGQFGIAIGNNIFQRGIYSVALGQDLITTNEGDYGVSIGAKSYLSDIYSVGVGYNDSIKGKRSIGIGAFSVVSSDSAIAIGANTNVSGSNSVAIGNGATTSQNNSMVLGGSTASNRMSVGIGTSTPNNKASLTLEDADKGFMINKMTTTQRTTFGGTLAASEQGMVVYDTDLNALYSWNGTAWNSNSNTDEQTLALTGTSLQISNGNSINLSGLDTDTQLSEAQVDGFVANNGYLTSFSEVDGSVTNEIQDISLTGTDLSLTSGSTIDLSSIDTDTDEQDLTSATLSGTNLQIEIENGSSVTVDLAPLLQGLQNQINDLQSRVDIIEDCACDGTLGFTDVEIEFEKPILYQNIPNPFNNTSSIKYYIPSWATSANLVVSDGMGKIVSNIPIEEVGDYGSSYVNAEDLNTGVYYYSLYVDQTLADTKKMTIH